MRRILLPLIATAAVVAGTAVSASAATRTLVAVTDQQGHQILVMDPAVPWADGAAVRWSWRPPVGTPGWWAPTDARLGRSPSAGLVMLTTDSDGYVAEVGYPSGRILWSVNVGSGQNPHTAELLPDGDVAVAASDGGWLRVYPTSRAGQYAQIGLTQAHGVVWDPGQRVLWALDAHYLVRIRVGGTAQAPTLKLLGRYRLPDPDGGHDLQPVRGDARRLWVSTGTHVYRFDKQTHTFSKNYPGARQISRYAVKSVGQDPATGQFLETTPNASCQIGNWCTDTVDFIRPGAHRTRPGAGIYKARWWSPGY